jgi:Fe-S cluster assembly scaffold protein SufB
MRPASERSPQNKSSTYKRGEWEREAISMIIRGFLDADIKGLGSELDNRIADITELAGHG